MSTATVADGTTINNVNETPMVTDISDFINLTKTVNKKRPQPCGPGTSAKMQKTSIKTMNRFAPLANLASESLTLSLALVKKVSLH